MTGTDIAIRESRELTVLTNEQLQYIAGTEFVPPGLRGNLPAILACVATGRALGIADMTSLRSIHIIDGKATYSAELMVMLARRNGHSITGEVTEGRALVTGTRKDNGDTMRVEWTLAMAERAGLLGKSNWKKYPEAMLWARAVSQLCRELFADCFAGGTYTPEEFGAETDESGEPLEGTRSTDPAAGTPFSDGWEDHPPDYNPSTPVALATAAQKKKLNVLVGTLRETSGGRVTTERLWASIAGGRQIDMEVLVKSANGRDVDGGLHWSPLRECLTKDEATELIEKLGAVETELAA